MKHVRILSASFCMHTLVAVLAVLTSTHAAVQESRSPASGAKQIEARRPRVRAPSASTSAATMPTFYLLAFAGALVHGKCLDFGPPPQVAGSPVFIYGCNGTVAQQVRVEEINDRHEVILHAGTKVIGIRTPMLPTLGGSAPGATALGTAPTEFRLELQKRANSVRPDSANQIFALDGDSIILARSRPCISTDTSLCPPPPPQLVVQVQNARGANRAPLVVGPRNLADSEFWEFKAVDGSDRYPTSGFVTVATDFGLWNAVCAFPKVRAGSLNIPIVDHPGYPDDGTLILTGPDAGPCSQLNIGWGSVIVVTSPNDCNHVNGPAPGQIQDIGGCIDLSNYPPIFLPAGVTVRGNRRGTNFGPQLYFSYQNGRVNSPSNCGSSSCMLEVRGDYVRVTGLRLRGESRSTDSSAAATAAIGVGFPGPATGPLFSVATSTQYIATIDHNDISDWGEAAVAVIGPYTFSTDTHSYTFTVNGQKYTQPTACSFVDPSTGANVLFADDPATLDNVRIERNFLHHNERWSGGYGSLMGAGGRAAISGNTFLMNRHAISGDGEGHVDYRAWYNLVLSDVPVYSLSQGRAQQIFDMHGTGPGGYGYIGGYRVDIAGNTFLGNIHNNWSFELRGHPCSTDYFRDNVAQREQDADGGGVINFHHIGDPGVPLLLQGPDVAYTPVTVAPDLRISEVLDYNNQFGNSSPPYTDPTVRLGPGSLGVGDFDGDGDDDLFLATGTAWYYSPGGAREWRFLSAKADTIEQLLFGDFDGDGRTDVVALRGGQFMISWGAVADWEVLNRDPTGGNLLLLPSAISAMAVGDFDGDGRADIFWADGQTWWISYGGNTPFVEVQTSSHRVKDIRFGDFDGNGTTDVFSVVSDGVSLRWMVSYSPKLAQGALFSRWTYLPVSLTNTVDGLLVADFDGDGVADVAKNSADGWEISYRGARGWTDVPQPLGLVSLALAGVGHFKGRRGADVLLWNGLSLGIISLATCDSNANVNTQLCISVGGTSPATRYSTQDMR